MRVKVCSVVLSHFEFEFAFAELKLLFLGPVIRNTVILLANRFKETRSSLSLTSPMSNDELRASLNEYYSSKSTAQATYLLTVALIAVGL